MKDKQSGFTLVEILVAIVLFGVVSAGITSLYISVQNIQRQAYYVDLATRAAQRQIESLRNDNYESLTPGQTITFTNQLPAALPPGKAGTAIISQPTTDLRRVDVTVSYPSGGKTRNVKLSSLIGVIGITQ